MWFSHPINITFVKLKEICGYRRIYVTKSPVNLNELIESAALDDILNTGYLISRYFMW